MRRPSLPKKLGGGYLMGATDETATWIKWVDESS